MKDLSGCALNQFRFSPATRDGEPVETNASLTIRFRVRGPDQSTGVSIENVGPLIIPPRIRAKGGDINTCLTADNPRPGSVSRFIATYTVLPDGSVQDLVLPPGSERSQEEIARCILNRAKFLPGTRDGVPVAAEVKMPIVLRADGSDEGAFITPTLRSTDEEVEAAYRACYPPELLTMAAAIYKFNVSTNGHVSNPKVVKGSGDPRIDDAGVCIMKMLEFSPLIQNGRAVKSYVTWELPIRPHR
jgi:TonB family protein